MLLSINSIIANAVKHGGNTEIQIIVISSSEGVESLLTTTAPVCQKPN